MNEMEYNLSDLAKEAGYSDDLCSYLHVKELEDRLFGNGRAGLPCLVLMTIEEGIRRRLSETDLLKISFGDMNPGLMADVILPGYKEGFDFEIATGIEEGTPEYERLLKDGKFDYAKAIDMLKEKHPGFGDKIKNACEARP